jgi:ATP-binding cassette subfamily C (CFTR/MRP) protein 1
VTAEVEKNFYVRCPPEKRPKSNSYQGSTTTSLPEQKAGAETTKDKEKQNGVWEPTPGIRDSKRSWFPQWPRKIGTGSDGQKYDSSLVKALHKTFFVRWWIAGLLKLIAGASSYTIFLILTQFLLSTDTLKTTTPLINKVILTWLTEAYIYHQLSDAEKAIGAVKKPQGIGYGIGLAFALFFMQGEDPWIIPLTKN